MKRLLFVYNPKAGKSKIRAVLSDVIEILDRAGYSVTVHPTRRKGDTTRCLSHHADEYDRVVVSGGDGTLNEALCGIRLATEKGKVAAPLGYIPTGSTNDFAISLGIPTDPVQAAKIAVEGDVFPCDAGTFNDRPFVYVAAFGAFTQASYATPQQSKNTLGHFAYLLEGLKELPQIKGIPFTITADGTVFAGKYLYGMVSNTTSVGGFNGIYSEVPVALDDGLLEVLLVKEPRSLAERSELMSDILRINLNSKYVTFLKAKNIVFSSQTPIPWTLDGEFGGTPNTAEISAIPDAYRLLIPQKPALPSKEDAE